MAWNHPSDQENLDALDESLGTNGFDLNLMDAGRTALEQYMLDLQMIVDLKKAGRDDEANELFYEDRGYTAWRRYAPSINAAKDFAEELDLQNEKAYKSSINSILLLLIIS